MNSWAGKYLSNRGICPGSAILGSVSLGRIILVRPFRVCSPFSLSRCRSGLHISVNIVYVNIGHDISYMTDDKGYLIVQYSLTHTHTHIDNAYCWVYCLGNCVVFLTAIGKKKKICFCLRMDDQDGISQASSVATISYFPVIKVGLTSGYKCVGV